MGGRHAHTDPEIDIDIIRRGMGSKNDPMSIAYRYDAPLTSKAVIDACRPYDHLKQFPDVGRGEQERCRTRYGRSGKRCSNESQGEHMRGNWAAALLAGALALSAQAQDYPSKSIRVLVSFAPGGVVGYLDAYRHRQNH